LVLVAAVQDDEVAFTCCHAQLLPSAAAAIMGQAWHRVRHIQNEILDLPKPAQSV